MPRQCGLNGNLSSLRITYLPHEDHIRVLSDDGSQPRSKGKIDLWINLHLTNTTDSVFDWILNGYDIDIRIINRGERGIEGGGFPRSGWAGYQDNTIWCLNLSFKRNKPVLQAYRGR